MTKTAAENNQAIAAQLSNNFPRLLRELSRDFDRRICEGLAARGHIDIRTSHSTVLGNLGMGDVRVTELAKHSQMTQQAMGKILKDLETCDHYATKVGAQQLEDLEHNLRSAVQQLHLHNLPASWTDP